MPSILNTNKAKLQFLPLKYQKKQNIYNLKINKKNFLKLKKI